MILTQIEKPAPGPTIPLTACLSGWASAIFRKTARDHSSPRSKRIQHINILFASSVQVSLKFILNYIM